MEEQPEPIPRTSAPVVTFLLAANVVVFLVLMSAPYTGVQYFGLWPLDSAEPAGLPPGVQAGEFHIWQLVTYAFLHGGTFHLLINMFVLWMFGGPVETVWGSRAFALYYAVCILGAGLVQLAVTSLGTSPVGPSVGASGGVFAILLAFGLMYPNQTVLLIFPPIPMKAKYFVIFIGLVELAAGVFGTAQGVANFAHLAGMVFGLLFMLVFRNMLRKPQGPPDGL